MNENLTVKKMERMMMDAYNAPTFKNAIISSLDWCNWYHCNNIHKDTALYVDENGIPIKHNDYTKVTQEYIDEHHIQYPNPAEMHWQETLKYAIFRKLKTSEIENLLNRGYYEPVDNPTGNPKTQKWYNNEDYSKVVVYRDYNKYKLNEIHSIFDIHGVNPLLERWVTDPQIVNWRYGSNKEIEDDHYDIVQNPTGCPFVNQWFEKIDARKYYPREYFTYVSNPSGNPSVAYGYEYNPNNVTKSGNNIVYTYTFDQYLADQGITQEQYEAYPDYMQYEIYDNDYIREYIVRYTEDTSVVPGKLYCKRNLDENVTISAYMYVFSVDKQVVSGKTYYKYKYFSTDEVVREGNPYYVFMINANSSLVTTDTSVVDKHKPYFKKVNDFCPILYGLYELIDGEGSNKTNKTILDTEVVLTQDISYDPSKTYYVLEKIKNKKLSKVTDLSEYHYYIVIQSPAGNPRQQQYYEKSSTTGYYYLSGDLVVDPNKTYYADTGPNPLYSKWYERRSNDTFFLSEDVQPVSGKTYWQFKNGTVQAYYESVDIHMGQGNTYYAYSKGDVQLIELEDYSKLYECNFDFESIKGLNEEKTLDDRRPAIAEGEIGVEDAIDNISLNGTDMPKPKTIVPPVQRLPIA